GFRLDYITPVRGAPWSIPLEFPLYQWIVAGVQIVTGEVLPLDLCGRLVSGLFFLLSIPPLFALARRLLRNQDMALLYVVFLLLNPIHLFWGRGFMIEATVLCFSAWFLWFFERTLRLGRVRNYVGAIVLGVLAALVKPTTYAVFLCAAFFFYAARFWRYEWPERNPKRIARFFLKGFCLTIFSLAAAWLWTHYSDGVKMGHPYTPLITERMHGWNYGTLAQRLNYDNWSRILLHYNGFVSAMSSWVGLHGACLAVGAALTIWLVFAGYRPLGVATLALVVVGPAVFFNLFFRHDYYQMAVTWASCFFAVLPFAAAIKNGKWTRTIRYVVIPLACVVLVSGYMKSIYYRTQHWKRTDNPGFFQLTEYIKQATDQKKDMILFVTPDGWNAKYAYYSERKSLCFGSKLTRDYFEDPKFLAMQEVLTNDGMRLRAIVTLGEKLQLTPALATYLKRRFNTPGKRAVMNGPVLLFDAADE
ncbi:MAG: glycosyltransferase family 39 protein, partial [Kiritimatiellia bacterium]|nr:glycosyltransferase family 39 protein [Kiritimatiellia bacterium]